MLSDQIRLLEHQHAELDRKIAAKEKTGIFEDLQLSDLKKQKLAIRDRLAALRIAEYEERQRVGYGDDE